MNEQDMRWLFNLCKTGIENPKHFALMKGYVAKEQVFSVSAPHARDHQTIEICHLVFPVKYEEAGHTVNLNTHHLSVEGIVISPRPQTKAEGGFYVIQKADFPSLDCYQTCRVSFT